MREMVAGLALLAVSSADGTAQPKDVELDLPPTAVVATIRIAVNPPAGAVLLYTAPDFDQPVRFPGPVSTRVVPLPSRTVRIELVDGAKRFRLKILGRIDALDGTQLKAPSR